MQGQLSDRLQQQVRNELKAGEHVQWMGQPSTKATAKMLMPILLFFIPWTAFALFWTAAAAGFKLPNVDDDLFVWLFPVFGLPFIMVGLWGLSMPWRMAARAKNTVYVITTQRVIILTVGKKLSCQSFYAKNLTGIRREQQPDGTGNLYFYGSQEIASRDKKMGFLGIAEVQHVEMLLLDLQRKNIQQDAP